MAAEKAPLHVLRDLHLGKEVLQAMLIEGVLHTDIIGCKNDYCTVRFMFVWQIPHQSVEDVFWSVLWIVFYTGQ